MRSATVLIVEDNEDIRDAIRELLQEEAYTVLEAGDGLTGLALLHLSQVALVVLLDYTMPRMDGFAMLRAVAQDTHLRARHSFILLTANDDRLPGEFEHLLAVLHVPIVGKPFELQELVDAVATARRALPEESGGTHGQDAFG
jgi:CheY-like chemotaxis protein